MDFLRKKDKSVSLDMVQELIESNRQLRAENNRLRKQNEELTEKNTDLTLENFRLTHPDVKTEGKTMPGLIFYAEMRHRIDENIPQRTREEIFFRK